MKGPNTFVTLSILCSYLLFSPLVSCEDPVITFISDEQIKEINQTVELNCTVQNVQQLPLLWVKLDKDRLNPVPLSTKSSLIINDKRVSVNFDTPTSTYTLRIKNLVETDTGYYQCQILLNLNNKVTSEVQLEMRRPPSIRSNTTRSVNVTEGKPIELHCDADGFPVPRISWKRQDDLLLSIGGAIHRGNVLHIPNAHRDDRGIYYCIAENGVGAVAESNVTVLVGFTPVITAVRPRVGQAQGYDASLECRVEAYPPPVVTWHKNGKELRREQIAASVPDEFVDTLHRSSVGSTDYGIYICRAENAYGHAETKVELFETIIPVCANSCG